MKTAKEASAVCRSFLDGVVIFFLRRDLCFGVVIGGGGGGVVVCVVAGVGVGFSDGVMPTILFMLLRFVCMYAYIFFHYKLHLNFHRK